MLAYELPTTTRISPRQTVKRLIDVLLSLICLIVIWPIMILIALLVRLDSPGSAFFRQVRSGLNGKPFNLYKFRSMYLHAEEVRSADGSTFVQPQDSRIPRVGRYLREFGLDELPQLVNILKGEMSLVGPRPIQPDQLDSLPERERAIYTAMRPGLTSLAQVSGRNELSWEKRRALEVYYVRNYRLWLDVRIALRTIPTLVWRKGVYNPAHLGNSQSSRQTEPG